MDVYLALQLLYDLVLLATCGYALLRGGFDECVLAIVMLASSAATAVVAAWPSFRWRDDHWLVLVIDAAALAGFAWRASVSRRFWPLWATAFQLNDVAVQGFMMVGSGRVRNAYVFLQGFWAYPILVVLAAATWRGSATSRFVPREPVGAEGARADGR